MNGYAVCEKCLSLSRISDIQQNVKWRYTILLAALAPLPAIGEGLPPQVKIDILVKQPLAKESTKPSCEQGDGDKDEIVVCAAPREDPEQFRLRPIKDGENFLKGPLKAKFALGENAALLAEGETADLGSGGQSKRLMVRMKIKF